MFFTPNSTNLVLLGKICKSEQMSMEKSKQSFK